MNSLFQNRSEAGMALAEMSGKYAGPGTVVFGLDRGGIVVAAELAHWLGSPLDLLSVQTFALPCDESAILGAVAPGNLCVLDDALLDRFDVETDTIHALRSQANVELEQQNRFLRGDRPLAGDTGRTVVLVSELVDSTLRIRAALLCLRQLGPHTIVVATPVITQAAVRELRPMVDDIVAVDTPLRAPSLPSVYVRADAVSDTEIRRILGVPEPSPEVLAQRATDD